MRAYSFGSKPPRGARHRPFWRWGSCGHGCLAARPQPATSASQTRRAALLHARARTSHARDSGDCRDLLSIALIDAVCHSVEDRLTNIRSKGERIGDFCSYCYDACVSSSFVDLLAFYASSFPGSSYSTLGAPSTHKTSTVKSFPYLEAHLCNAHK